MRGEYALLLLVSLSSVLLVNVRFRLRVFEQWLRLCLTLVPLTVLVLVWDLVGVERWGWRSNQRLLLGPYALGGRIPLEELLFPIVVISCTLVVWELVKARRGHRADTAREH
jgi:lycopene cyclase domain-containing protein